MQNSERVKLCKLQNNPGGEDVYIVYTTYNSNNPKEVRLISSLRKFTNKPNHHLQDFAGLFDKKEDAEQVAKCLNNIFSKLHDDNWVLLRPYKIRTVFSESYDVRRRQYNDILQRKYSVISVFSNIDPSKKPFKQQHIVGYANTRQDAQKTIQEYKELFKDVDYQIVNYKTNDILPTMYIDDYNKKLHQKKFKHVINHLKDIPHAQANRQQMRRAARENLLQYSDSSDSEDESNYKRMTPKSALGTKTKRSLLHTPTRRKK